MHFDIPRLTELVTLFTGGPSMGDRLAADRRIARYFNAYGLRRDAACLLDQLAQAKTSDPISPSEAKRVLGRRGQVVNLRPRTPDLCMAEIREKIGGDAIETVEGYGWRLTPLGRFRARRAQGESLQL